MTSFLRSKRTKLARERRAVRSTSIRQEPGKWACQQLIAFCSPHGTVGRLAEYLEVSPSIVSRWINGVVQVPAERCLEISRFTNGLVQPSMLRPDIDWTVIKNK